MSVNHAVKLRDLRPVDISGLKFDSEVVKYVREQVHAVFGIEPCLWQIQVALATLKGDKNVVSISRTGSGKTMTFWIPVILKTDGYLIVVVPLNVLGKQNTDQLTRVGIPSVVVSAETASSRLFKVMYLYII